MRRSSRAWYRRSAALLLALCVGSFSVMVGAHVQQVPAPAGNLLGPTGSLYDPGHRHGLGAEPSRARDYGRDLCALCLAHTGVHAVAHDAPALHPAGTQACAVALVATRRALGPSSAQPPSRAPPRI